MKRMLMITFLILGMMPTYSFAQMGHGMMRDMQGMEQGHMMEQREMMDKGKMMEHGKMMGNMMGMTRDMSNMMSQISETMGNMSGREVSRERIHKISDIMRDMAAEMNRMSWMMDRGTATEEEMRDVQNRMMEIQRQMSEIKK